MLISQILSGIVAVYVIVPNSNSDYPHSHFFDLYVLTFIANITLRKGGISIGDFEALIWAESSVKCEN